MKNNDSNRELEEQLSLLQPQSTSPGFDRKLQEALDNSLERNGSPVIPGSSNWKLTALGLAAAAVAVVIIVSISLPWSQTPHVEPPEVISKKSNSPDPNPKVTTIANFNLAIRRGDDIEDLLNRQCDSSLPNYPLTDVVLDGATGFLDQNY